MDFDKKPIITVTDAKKLMGDPAANYSDATVAEMIMQLEIISEILGKESAVQILGRVPKST